MKWNNKWDIGGICYANRALESHSTSTGFNSSVSLNFDTTDIQNLDPGSNNSDDTHLFVYFIFKCMCCDVRVRNASRKLTTKAVVSTSLLFIRSSLTCSQFSPSSVTNLENVPLGLPYLQGMIEVRSGPLLYRKRASSDPILDPEIWRQTFRVEITVLMRNVF